MGNTDKVLYEVKSYKHIDKPISFDRVKKYVQNPIKIAGHSFLPFLHFTIKQEKYDIKRKKENAGRPIKTKEREIFYASHLDQFIYRYYSDYLNDKYNQHLNALGLDEVVTAYRNNKKGKSNIDFAADVISKITLMNIPVIIVGDFTKYFDNLNHQLLKTRLKRILELELLPKDWFNVFKSITKFGYVDKNCLEDISDPLIMNTETTNSYFQSNKEFYTFKKNNKNLMKFNVDNFGIPQGTSLSGVLANIYAIDFDYRMNEIAEQFGGFYNRYSDDFILVLNGESFDNGVKGNYICKEIEKLASDNRIELQPDKTSAYILKDGIVQDFNTGKPTRIDYLGFTFDGTNVRMRERSIYKFYRKARRLIAVSKAKKYRLNLKGLPNRHKIYSLYTDIGYSKKYRSNFITYAKRSQRIFDAISPNTNNLMMEQLKNRKKKIEKELGYKMSYTLK